jgi:CBS domain-containing protein
MKVKELLTGNPVLSVHAGDDLAMATQMMLWAGVHHLPALDENGQLIGILTDRDILVRRTQAGHAAELETVATALSALPATCTPDEDLAEAAERMIGRGVSALAVVETEAGTGRVVAILTTTDLVQYLAEPQHPQSSVGPTVREVMHKNPLTAVADDYLMDALLRMAERNIRHLPVISGDRRVVGMLSDRDIRTAIGDPSRAILLERTRVRLQSLRVGSVMSSPAITVPLTLPLGEAATRFVDQRLGALPVVDAEQHLTGIVSYVDLLRAAFCQSSSHGVRRSVANHAPYLRR